ncbi:hypothetical protein JOB18_041016 [Solea senegalensis]|uniref:Uncharacterized protein n=1 Tax=Solea senegalensis TaxID=28829 RepID=A0AAV6Q2H6_SOLSE|nr:hypothetical protein JOB18_041016 [Solea senegalensis]
MSCEPCRAVTFMMFHVVRDAAAIRSEEGGGRRGRGPDVHFQLTAASPANAGSGSPHCCKYVNMLTWKDVHFSSVLAALCGEERGSGAGRENTPALHISFLEEEQTLESVFKVEPCKCGRFVSMSVSVSVSMLLEEEPKTHKRLLCFSSL